LLLERRSVAEKIETHTPPKAASGEAGRTIL
jgi:hypothetical protein